MSVEVALESPLAHALNTAIQPKLVEVGWSTGGDDDSALSEYIILMLVNGKTQDQIAAELSGDLLNLGPDDPGARDFSRWLFEQVEVLNSQLSGGNGGFPSDSGVQQAEATNEEQDADMGDVPDAGQPNVPTGPKSMRENASRGRDKRMLGHLAKSMDRTNDTVLHRIRGHGGTERINSHSRAPPTGPRQAMQNRAGSRMLNGGRGNPMSGAPMQSSAAMNVMNMPPQAQMQMLANLEQQMKGMAQMMGFAGNGMGNGFAQQQQPGKSLFDRVQPNPHRGQHNGFRRGGQAPRAGEQHQAQAQNETPSSSMDVEMSQEKREPPSPDSTCKYNLSCTNKDCKFAHQSPAAPPGTTIDPNDVCSFGAACKNRKCVGRHPSPAQKIAHQTEVECRFFPNCTNPRCPFRHPTMPLCRNGADCTTPNCKFTHAKVMCKFNPCLNAACPYKHVEGQKRGKFEDKVWVADESKEHVSERKFVDENTEEELIKPGDADSAMKQESSAQAELVT